MRVFVGGAVLIVDQVDSGDRLIAGAILGNRQESSPQETIDFAGAAAFSKHFIEGDATAATIDQIHKNARHHG